MQNIENCIQYIDKYYSSFKNPLTHPPGFLPDNIFLYNVNHGIGDSLILFLFDDVSQNTKNISIAYNQTVAEELKDFNKYTHNLVSGRSSHHEQGLFVCEIQDKVKYPGHFIQNIQHCLGMNVQKIPKPILSCNIPTVKNRVVMTFDRGAHGAYQTNIHPRPRLLYPEHQESIQKFINQNKNKYEFIEVGKNKSTLYNIEDKTNLGIKATAEIIASCDFFFGMHNGLMHIAAGLDKKSIIIVNFPEVNHLVLPMLQRSSHPDMDWLYPQNVHLHQDGSSILVPHLSYTNIQLAFDGEIYPFFTHMHKHINKE